MGFTLTAPRRKSVAAVARHAALKRAWLERCGKAKGKIQYPRSGKKPKKMKEAKVTKPSNQGLASSSGTCKPSSSTIMISTKK